MKRETWTRDDLIKVRDLLKLFTVQEVADQTGMSIGRIEKRAHLHGWPTTSMKEKRA